MTSPSDGAYTGEQMSQRDEEFHQILVVLVNAGVLLPILVLTEANVNSSLPVCPTMWPDAIATPLPHVMHYIAFTYQSNNAATEELRQI